MLRRRDVAKKSIKIQREFSSHIKERLSSRVFYQSRRERIKETFRKESNEKFRVGRYQEFRITGRKPKKKKPFANGEGERGSVILGTTGKKREAGRGLVNSTRGVKERVMPENMRKRGKQIDAPCDISP